MADCGAGIGRVTEGLLMQLCAQVDLVEPDEVYLKVAEEKVGSKCGGEFFLAGLQSFTPEPGKYHIIWLQWVALYLTDDDMVNFFHRCKTGLAKGGTVFVKENIATSSGFVLDKEDNSITRCDRNYKTLFKQAGMKLIGERTQDGFPDELFNVKMYALR